MKNFLFKKKNDILLIYGHRGWIGSMYIDYLVSNFPKLEIVKGEARIDTIDVNTEIDKYSPTHVVSFTGRTHGMIEGKLVNTIDYLEYPGKLVENVKDNLYGPVNLAIICKEKGIHYTYLGTGCIYNSKNINNGTLPVKTYSCLQSVKCDVNLETDIQQFSEESLPNYFGSGYSTVKGFTDRLMASFPVLNLRIRMPISSISNDRNFINKIAKYPFICSIPNSMTVLDDFFPIFTDLILKKKIGTYNCTNPGIITHNQILTMYKQIIDTDFTWNNMSIEDQSKMLKCERSNNYLDTSKIEKEFPKLRSINDSMIIVLNKMKLKKK